MLNWRGLPLVGGPGVGPRCGIRPVLRGCVTIVFRLNRSQGDHKGRPYNHLANQSLP